MKSCCIIFPNTYVGSLVVAVFGMITNVVSVVAASMYFILETRMMELYEEETGRKPDKAVMRQRAIIYISICAAKGILDLVLFVCVRKKECGRNYLVFWGILHLAFIGYILADNIEHYITFSEENELIKFDYVVGGITLGYVVLQLYGFWCVMSQHYKLNKVEEEPEEEPEDENMKIVNAWKTLQTAFNPKTDVNKDDEKNDNDKI
ncbi:Uncharacterised protein g10007 [Pycnogonum litorale]